MFTGIIEEVGHLRYLGGGRIEIACQGVTEGTRTGDSISVNGICLTVTELFQDGFTADVMPETMRRTSLEGLKPGAALNLERALTPSSRMGGHIVSGHIDGVGRITELKQEGNAILLAVSAAPEITRYVVRKGSVALDGISLTVVEASAESFTVSLIPHTRENTNLREKNAGSRINIETDVIGKYVERLLQGRTPADGGSPEITMDFLQANGF